MNTELVVRIEVLDKEGNKYNDLFIKNLDESLTLIWNDYAELEKARRMVKFIEARIETRQGHLKYGVPKKRESFLSE